MPIDSQNSPGQNLFERSGGIIANDIAHCSGLLILNEFGGVTADTERCVKDVSIAEQSETAAARDLAAGVFFGLAGDGNFFY